jgi:hypothetical protein
VSARDPTRNAILLSASGEMAVTYAKVGFEFGRGRGKVRWSATVAIIEQGWQEAVFGHAGFLEYFDTTFLGLKQEIRVKRNARSLPK